MNTVTHLHEYGVLLAQACVALDLPHRSYYHKKHGYGIKGITTICSRPPRSLAPEERDEVRQLLESPHFVDQVPRQVCSTLLDEEGIYHVCRTYSAGR